MEEAASRLGSAPLPEPPSPLPPAAMTARIVAGIIDIVLAYLAAVVAMVVFSPMGSMAVMLVGIAVPWLYSAWCEASAAQATPGKKLARLAVTDAYGGRLGFGRASLRFIGKLAIVASCGLGLLLALFIRDRRALDDLIAGTRVGSLEAGKRRLWLPVMISAAAVAALIAAGLFAIDTRKDYELRARIAGLLDAAQAGLKSPYTSYYRTNGRPPARADLPFSHPLVETVDIDSQGTIVLRLRQPGGAVLRLVPAFAKDGTVTWTCHASAERMVQMPPSCRS